MSKKNPTTLNIDLPEKLDGRFNAHILLVAQNQGKVPFGIRTTIVLKALEEYLDKHEKDATIDYSRPTGNRKS